MVELNRREFLAAAASLVAAGASVNLTGVLQRHCPGDGCAYPRQDGDSVFLPGYRYEFAGVDPVSPI